MNRRAFVTGLGAVLAAPLAAEAQQVRRVPRLCFLTFDPGTAEAPSPRFAAFFQGLRDLGYVHGQTITIDYIVAEGRAERYPELASECVRLKPDIIAVTTTPGARALKNATQTIPIVMVALGDPVGTGLVDSLARPGRNLTGMSQMTSGLAAKRLEVLKEAVPSISRVLVLAYLVDPISPLQVKTLSEVAPARGVTLLIHDVRTADDLSAAFDAAVKERAQGLLTTAESFLRLQRARVTELAARHKLPAVYPYGAFVTESGGLMAYEVNDSDLHRRAAGYVDKLLKGAKASELAVQQPTKFELIINLKTAKALGLTIPPSLLLRADQIIE